MEDDSVTATTKNEKHGQQCAKQRETRARVSTRTTTENLEYYQRPDDDGDDVNLKAAIDYAVKQGKKKLHRTMDPDDPNLHRAYVCIVCDCFVPSSEPLKTMTRDQLMIHQRRLGVHEYEEYHNVTLKPELIKQYHVTVFF